MLELIALSCFVGSLGLQAVSLGQWQNWQLQLAEQNSEEEELLTRYDSQEYMTASANGRPANTAPRRTAPPTAPPESGYYNPNAAGVKDPRLAGWEFKIVRASRDLFRDPAVFRRLCQEEAEAGWVLLEKLDDRRVRFKRPIALRDIVKPEFLSHDPYRCHYGPTLNTWTSLGAIAALMAILLPAYLGYTLVTVTLNPKSAPPTPTQPANPPFSNSPSGQATEPAPQP